MILFDGCSWTRGDELKDPEKCRFSTLVSDGKDHVNLSWNGKSNDGILRTTMEFCERNTVDIAIIQFTVFSRTEFRCEKTDNYFPIGVGVKKSPAKEKSEIYYEYLHNNNLHMANYHKNKFLLESYFKSKGIKYYFVNLERYRDTVKTIPSSWYNMMDKNPVVSLRSLLGDKDLFPENYCLEKRGHPNEKGHKIISDHILEFI
tara:strand:- start:47 stop:655 length:609 start_codon:yes stop_codon:yes gene_type:complete